MRGLPTAKPFGILLEHHPQSADVVRPSWSLAEPNRVVSCFFGFAPSASSFSKLNRTHAAQEDELLAVERERYLGKVSREQIFALMHLRASSFSRFRPLEGGSA
ncbi:hypothetical protein [Deinococcus yavapaiensis]|uniref:Uncharacterized protein n=1 Tax=Deinococcus yavapaiensis KR-236 TaxID=694435 RepID=A0A318SBG4_9DEIO|nr:hypothetical protein [Deinococcus yavapaiensis]PYE54541.1 hypothetical protein DES52_105179 [Deinococcus yavapaiensis KR-236]